MCGFARKLLVALAVCASSSSAAWAGPIIIAGTDADDHGFASGGVNMDGWEFMQSAFVNLAAALTNSGTNIVCLGCNGSTASDAFASAINLSSIAATFNEQTINAPADITSFLTGGTVTGLNLANTGIIYMNSGFNVGGGMDNAQVAAVNAQGMALNNFIIGGGGLFTQSQAANTGGFGWLTSLLPGLVVETSVADDSTLELTAAGNAAFPGLTDVEASNATPWHNWFSGDFGALDVLVTGNGNGVGGLNDAVVLGGGTSGAIICGQPGFPPCPDPDHYPRAHHDGASRNRPSRIGFARSGASRRQVI